MSDEMMTKRQKLIRALQILEAASPGDWTSAEHDVIYLGGETPLTDEARIELDALGCFYDDDVESWAMYT